MKQSESKATASYHVLDASTSNVLYSDSEGCMIYPWYLMNANSISKAAIPKPKTISSLKLLCVDQIALESEKLTMDHLLLLNWNHCGKLIWNRILELQTDSFYVFLIFNSIFGMNNDFHCHRRTSSIKTNSFWNLRQCALNACITGFSYKHRIENIHSNIDYQLLSNHLNQLNNSMRIILDLSQCFSTLSNFSFLSLLKINNLWALDLSNQVHVNDNILRIISKAEILPNLQILKIVNCPNVTLQGVETLVRNPHSNIKYIESDYGLPLEPFHTRYSLDKLYVLGTKWNCLEKSSSAYNKLNRSFAFASNSLAKHYPELFKTKNNNIVLDIIIFKESASVENDTSASFQKSWQFRLNSSMSTSRTGTPFAYLNEQLRGDSSKPKLHQFRHKIGKSKKVMKKKPQTANEYFGLCTQ